MIIKLSVVLILLVAAGCAASRSYSLRRNDADDFRTSSIARTGAAVGRGRLDADILFLDTLGKELDVVLEQAAALSRRIGDRAEFAQDDADRFAYVLYRFLICRAGMWDIAEDYQKSIALFRVGTDRLLARLISYRVMMQLAHADSRFALTFYDQPAAQGLLNRAYRDLGIESGTYTVVLQTAVKADNIDARDAAWHHFQEALKTDRSLQRGMARDACVRQSVYEIERNHVHAEASLRRLLDKRGVVFPVFENRVRQSMAVGALKTVADAGLRGLGAVGSLTLQLVRPLVRSPFATGTQFTTEQVETMKLLLAPGDLVFVYTSGYLTSFLFPGVFKHGIVYVGTPEQRHAVGLDRDWKTRSIRDDMIESVARGVGWIDLKKLTDGRVTLIAALRPQIGTEARRAFLHQVFSYLERPYDLRFDFMCPIRLCCTELIYHGLNGKAGIDFPMVQRMGMPTLAPDDILNYYLTEPGRRFDLLFVGAPDAESNGKQGRLWTGPEAVEQVRVLLR